MKAERKGAGGVRSPGPFLRCALTPFLVLWGASSSFSLAGCASSQGQAHIGYSNGANATEETEISREDDAGEDEAPSLEDAPEDPLPAPTEPKEAELARIALARAEAPGNHLQLKFAVVERASDLPWILAVQNVASGPIELAALPELISFTVSPKIKPDEEGAPAGKAPEPVRCTALPKTATLPKQVGENERVTLERGQLLYHAFDPRELCESEKILRQGSSITLTYGFPTQTKKLWKAGKIEEVEIEQTAPFVAERKSDGEEEFLPLKHLVAPPFELGLTYPLSELTALPTSQNEEDDADKTHAPPPPLVLAVSPLGRTSSPEAGDVTVQMKNQSKESIKIFLRRELFTYEVLGPSSGTTCHMHPADRHPTSSEFVTISPGSSYTLRTRMAEACPKGTFGEPGTYFISARFQASQGESESDVVAFSGSARTESPARLIIPGQARVSSMPRMQIAEPKAAP